MLLNARFKVSKKLLLKLSGCAPNPDMNRMHNLKFITLLSITKRVGGRYLIVFKEITGGNVEWCYTEGFVEELKNCKVNYVYNNELDIE